MFFFKKNWIYLSLSLCTMGTLYLVVRLQVCKSQTVMNYDVCCLDVFVPEGCQNILGVNQEQKVGTNLWANGNGITAEEEQKRSLAMASQL